MSRGTLLYCGRDNYYDNDEYDGSHHAEQNDLLLADRFLYISCFADLLHSCRSMFLGLFPDFSSNTTDGKGA